MKEDNAIVTVLIPVFNTKGEYLSESINSIISQEIPNKFTLKVLIIDDGSTNTSTLKVLETYKTMKNIIILSNDENKGVSYSLNKGIEASLDLKAKYIVRMDSDDISTPDRLKRQIEFLENNDDIDILGGSVRIFEERSKSEKIYDMPTNVGEVHFSMFFFCSIAHPSIIFRSKIFIDYPDLRFSDNYPKAEDYALWLNIVTKTNIRISNLPQPYIVHLRKHNYNESKLYRNQQKQASCKALASALSNITNIEFDDNIIKALLSFVKCKEVDDFRKIYSIIEEIESFLLSCKHIKENEKIEIRDHASRRLGEYALYELQSSQGYNSLFQKWISRNPKDLINKLGELISDSEESYAFDSNIDQKGITVICFSKDRAFQLKEYLRTLLLNINKDIELDIYVLWKASDDKFQTSYEKVIAMFPNVNFVKEINFADQLLDIVNKSRRYILWGVDDVIFYNYIDLETIMDCMDTHTDIISCILKLSPEIVFCQPSNKYSKIPKQFIEINENILKYDRTETTEDWNYPFELSSAVMRKKDVISYINTISKNFGKHALSHPNKFEISGSRVTSQQLNSVSKLKYCLCMKKQVMSIITVNIVQSVCSNPLFDEIDLETMDSYLHQGLEYDLDYYKNKQFLSTHIGDFILSKKD